MNDLKVSFLCLLPSFLPNFSGIGLIFLVDPEFRTNNKQAPLSLELERSKWSQFKPYLFQRERLFVVVMCAAFPPSLLIPRNSWFDKQWKLFQPFKSFLEESRFHSQVIVSVFTQPYCRVEENNDVISLYNSLVEVNHNVKYPVIVYIHFPSSSPPHNQYLHLADYATRTNNQHTLVWKLVGRVHDQDEAVLREMKRLLYILMNSLG